MILLIRDDIAIQDLGSGEIRQLTHNADQGDTTWHNTLNSAISKDGKQIASCWLNPKNIYDLILVDVEKISQKTIYRQEEYVYPKT